MKPLFLSLGLLSAAACAIADDAPGLITLSPGLANPALHREWMQLAATESSMTSTRVENSSTDPHPATAADDWFTPNKTHEYLGLGSLALAGLAIIAPKPDDEGGNRSSGGIHHDLAVGATVLGAGAVATGFLFHYKDLDLSKGFKDPDNLHMLLGILAESAFVAAVAMAPEGGHAGAGALGAVAMAMAIKIEW
jgi:hypothetical protein